MNASDTKHTPGPWELTTDNLGACAYLLGTSDADRASGQHYYVPLMRTAWEPWMEGRGWRISRAEYEANARLITAAPELADALENMLAYLEDEGVCSGDPDFMKVVWPPSARPGGCHDRLSLFLPHATQDCTRRSQDEWH